MNRSLTTRSIPIAAAIFAVAGGLLSILGRIFDQPRLLDWLNTGIEIKGNTAIVVFVAGLALLAHLLWPARWYVSGLLGLLVALVAGATLAQHITGNNLGIDTFVFDELPGAPATTSPGRMGIPASSSLALLGLALIFLPFNRRLRMWASFLATLALAIASLSLVGYLFGANQLYSIATFTGIAFQTASMIAVLGLGVAWAVPEQGVVGTLIRDDTGGLVFRRLIVPAILASLILGYLRIVGQRAGLYDIEFGTATRTLAEILLLLVLLWRTTNDISRAEAETRLLARLPAENPNPVMRLSAAGDLLYANEAAAVTTIDWTQGAGDPVADQLRASASEALGTNTKVSGEVTIGERIYSCTFAPIVDGGYVNIYADDITERKLAAEQLSRRVREQGALYRFTNRLARSPATDDINEAALDAISDALGCERASILLFDEDSVMSFVAWRGLSDEYRRAVNGHSPWTRDTRDPNPFGIDDIEQSDQPDELKTVILQEGIRALGFIPLVSNEKLIGKFMVYYDQPHAFTEQELELSLAIGQQIAFGVERRRNERRRRETEAALRENDARLRLATRTGKVGVWDWDILTNRVSWTESLYAMHGVDQNGFDGSVEGFAALVHPDDREFVRKAIAASLAGDVPYQVEFRVPHPDGKIAWLFTDAAILREGGEPVRMIGATVEVTDRKQAEAESAKLAAIVQSSADAIISKDINGVIMSWNRGAEHLFGYTAAETIGQPVTILIPEERIDEEPDILSRIRRGEVIDHYETVRRRKDGTLLEISLTVSPIIDAHGDIIGASKIARDITDNKRAAAAMRESEILHTLVDAQESERHRIARDLHDHLGQQLTALRLKLESIRLKAAGSEELLAEIDETREQASRIDLDINFLSWELRPTELDNLGLRDAVSSFVREWSANYGIAAEFHASGTRGERLHPDIETNLYRIVQEGLNNVLKHANATKVNVLLESQQDKAVMIIEDDGIGFEHDLSAPRNGNGKKVGGLGLIGMRERTALLGGSLEIETRPGKGTSVFARVPLRGREAEE